MHVARRAPPASARGPRSIRAAEGARQGLCPTPRACHRLLHGHTPASAFDALRFILGALECQTVRGVVGRLEFVLSRRVVDLLEKLLKDVIHVVHGHRAGLGKVEPVLPGKLSGGVIVDLPGLGVLFGQVHLVSHKHDHDVWLSILPQLLHPLHAVLEGGLLHHVIDEQSPHGSAVMGAGDRSVPLLASRVPDLGFHLTPHFQLYRFRGKLHADRRRGSLRQRALDVAREEVRLPDRGVADQHDLVEVVIVAAVT
mmetsp:Transcript_10713/g.33344  ORF Transcript_10713/g.33344 Transcript_10713/m.33344 type:complete len:255 (+) Transcript_10713:117-881(+)